MAAATTTANSAPTTLGPGAIAEPGVPGGPGVSLARPEWITIQVYVANARGLPANEDDMRRYLGPGAPDDLSDFDQLISVDKTIAMHCTRWAETTFPRTVSLASDIVNYGKTKAPEFYPQILTEAALLVDDPQNAAARVRFRAILASLRETVTGYARKAAECVAAIRDFVAECEADEQLLTGPDGVGHYYEHKYSDQSNWVRQLTGDLAGQRAALAEANAEYERDVTIACTTATYVWIVPEGLIAAAVVAGVYGRKALDALDDIRAAQEKIDRDKSELAVAANTMLALDIARASIAATKAALAAALPALEGIQNVWSSIGGSLGNLIATIDDDISAVPPMIMNVGVEDALKRWYTAALAADVYRTNAFVQQEIQPAPDVAAPGLSSPVRRGQL